MHSRILKIASLSLGKTLTGLIGVLTLAVMARIFSTSDYAAYNQTMLAFNFAIPFMTMAIPQSLYYFMASSDESDKRSVLSSNLVLLFAGGLIFALFIFLGGNRLLAWKFNNNDLIGLLPYIAPLAIFYLPVLAVAPCLVVQNKVFSLTVYNIATKTIIGLTIIFACFLWKTPSACLIANVLISFVVFIISIAIMEFSIPKGTLIPKKGMLSKIFAFNIPLTLSSLIGNISVLLDKLIVSSMCDKEQFAIYVNGAIQLPLINILTTSISTVILADMTKMIKNGNKDEALKLFRQASEKCAMILIPVSVFLFVCAQPFIVLVFSEKYRASTLPFMIYLFNAPIKIVSYGTAQMTLGMPKAILHKNIVNFIINIVLGIMLVKYFGYIGAAIASVATIYIWNVPANTLNIAKGFGCKWYNVLPFAKMLEILGMSLIPAIPIYFIQNRFFKSYSTIGLAVNSIIFCVCMISLFTVTKQIDIKAIVSILKAKTL